MFLSGSLLAASHCLTYGLLDKPVKHAQIGRKKGWEQARRRRRKAQGGQTVAADAVMAAAACSLVVQFATFAGLAITRFDQHLNTSQMAELG